MTVHSYSERLDNAMYVGQLTFVARISTDLNDVSHAIHSLLNALRLNGQICGQKVPIAVDPGGYVATVFLPERNSLDAKYHDRHVRQGLQGLGAAGLAEPTVVTAPFLEGLQGCACDRRQSLILYTHLLSVEPPIRCGSCFLPVPLYRLPSQEEAYRDVDSWQSSYRACDTLQVSGGVLERTAIRQLSRLDSSLSQKGLAVCRRIHEATRIPVYYYLYRYGARSWRQEQKRLCPSCQGEWLLTEPWHLFNFKCDRCRLLSNIAWDVRRG